MVIIQHRNGCGEMAESRNLCTPGMERKVRVLGTGYKRSKSVCCNDGAGSVWRELLFGLFDNRRYSIRIKVIRNQITITIQILWFDPLYPNFSQIARQYQFSDGTSSKFRHYLRKGKTTIWSTFGG
jgi:hypothetical protein